VQAKLKLNQGYKGKKKKAEWNNFQKGESSNKWCSKAKDEKANNSPCGINLFSTATNAINRVILQNFAKMKNNLKLRLK
jgi:hypothetical protein